MINYITINLSPAKGQRVDTRFNREHLVVPAALITPGVLNGSAGALYYPTTELKRDPQIWDGIPITIEHPVSNDGTPISARVAGVKHFGTVLNTEFLDGKLRAEAWFDVAALEADAEGRLILEALRANKTLELSTGLYTRNENKSGTDDQGRSYDAIARDYRPDHLAILLKEKGACSLNDGCGLNVTNKDDEEPTPLTETDVRKIVEDVITSNSTTEEAEMKREQMLAELTANCQCDEKKKTLEGMSDDQLAYVHELHVANSKDDKEDKDDKPEPPAEPKPEPTPAPTGNNTPDPAAPKQLTTEEWFAQAPPEVGAIFQSALAANVQAKKQLIDVITKNEKNTLSEAILQTMDLEQLRGIAAIAANSEPEYVPAPNYFGQATPAPTGNNSKANEVDEDDVLVPPTANEFLQTADKD